jgi:hypothetical protein
MVTKTVSQQRAAAQKITARKLDELVLDPQNPRLAIEGRSISQDAILERMYIDEALEELATSFARNGYFWEEPLVVVPSSTLAGKFVVVEGNRRLAALKILTSPALRKKLHVTSFPELTSAQLAEFRENVPTVTYPSREMIVPYLGFRHITGVKRWEPYAKSRYIAGLIDTGVSISQIEESIGDEARTVKKLYQCYLVYQQIEHDLSMDIKEVRSNFSLLEVTLGQQPLKDLLGVPKALPTERRESVIPAARLPALREVVSWVYGDPTAGELRVISDSREISKRLAPVVANDEAREYLRRTRDLEGAYERTGGERQYYLKQVIAAGRAVERALGVASLYKGDAEIVSQVDRLATLVEALTREARG